MIFTEHRFVLFFGVVFAAYWALRSLRSRKVFLVLASYVFYGIWDWRFLSLLWTSTLVDYFLAKRIEGTESVGKRRAWLMVSLTMNLGMLAVFKYLDFFLQSTVEFLDLLGFEASIPVIGLVLPIGISFYTFQTLSYTLDVYKRKESANHSLLDLALFVGFFPQLVAGPIVRSREFLPQLKQAAKWCDIPVRAMLWLFVIGFFKKACISDNIYVIVDTYYADIAAHTRATGVLAGLLFSVQLYCDFSGYSDMAIACAGLLGSRLPMNFYYPLLSADYTKLMNRWHMSLSRWVRDYIYLPMVGRNPSGRYQLWCLAVTMGLMGLWHGAGWHLVNWGLRMGVGVAVHRIWQRSTWSKIWTGRGASLVAFAITYTWLLAMLVLFRAPDMGEAMRVFRTIGGLDPAGDANFGSYPWVVMGALALVHYLFYTLKPEVRLRALPDWAFAVLLGVLGPVFLAFAKADVKPFIYFQF